MTAPADTTAPGAQPLARAAAPAPAIARRTALILLGAILVAALALRLWNLDHGLPFAYNADEAEHFVPKAIEMFRGGLDPGYYENPPALTYLLYAIFKLRFTAGFPFGGGRDLVRGFAADPEAAFLTARLAVALIGTLVAGLAYWAGARFYERRVGLVAAALMAVAFLPVFYSKHALNDVVTLAPVTVAPRRLPARLRARPLARLGARGRRDRRRYGDEVHGRGDAADRGRGRRPAGPRAIARSSSGPPAASSSRASRSRPSSRCSTRTRCSTSRRRAGR